MLVGTLALEEKERASTCRRRREDASGRESTVSRRSWGKALGRGKKPHESDRDMHTHKKKIEEHTHTAETDHTHNKEEKQSGETVVPAGDAPRSASAAVC